MQEDLRRSNTIGDSKGIRYFASIVLKNGEIKLDSARQICSLKNDIRVSFNSAVAFFEYLGFISVSNTTLIPTKDGKRLFSLIDSGFDEMLCEECLNKIISEGIIDFSALRFDMVGSRYFIQRHGFPISAAVLRNILIQLNALTERRDGALELTERYEAVFAKAQKSAKRKMSLESLKKQMEKQEAQGEAAELFVLECERLRLSGTPNLARVRRISDIDVTAGYDIVSFEGGESTGYDRFVEVKSYLGQPHFYWSKNEIDAASLLGNRYYICLVDVEKVERSDYTPTIIRDPVKAILNSDDWLMQPTSYYIVPTGE